MDLSGALWHKSSHSGGQSECVEVAVIGNRRRSDPGNEGAGYCFALRDSKDPDGPLLYLTSGEWEAFRRNLKNGMFDDLTP